MSTVPPTARDRPAEIVAGFLATLAMAGGAIALVVRPVPVGVLSIVIGFLAAAGVTIASLGFLGGMIVCVLTSRPLW